MNLKKEMLIIDEKIVTSNVSFCEFNVNTNTYRVKYKNSNKVYNYSATRLELLNDPTIVNLNDYMFYINNKKLQNIKEVYEFTSHNHSYYHVAFNNNSYADYKYNELKKVSKNCDNVIEYMKKVSNFTSLSTEDGKKLLYEQMKKINLNDLNTALANYLKLSNKLTKENSIETLIFPFGCNSSQYEAVENAIYNKISVIEGPPGTGKTQTILNIIANIIIRNMNCQVVSNNNTAIKNIDEKLKKYNLDFFEALLGRRKNKELFVEQQNSLVPKFTEVENMNLDDIAMILKSTNQIVKEVYTTKKEIANLIQRKNDLDLEYKYFKELVKSQKIEIMELKKYNINKVKLLWNEILTKDTLSIWDKLKYIFIYKIGNFKFYNHELTVILKSLQNLIYLNDLKK